MKVFLKTSIYDLPNPKPSDVILYFKSVDTDINKLIRFGTHLENENVQEYHKTIPEDDLNSENWREITIKELLEIKIKMLLRYLNALNNNIEVYTKILKEKNKNLNKKEKFLEQLHNIEKKLGNNNFEKEQNTNLLSSYSQLNKGLRRLNKKIYKITLQENRLFKKITTKKFSFEHILTAYNQIVNK